MPHRRSSTILRKRYVAVQTGIDTVQEDDRSVTTNANKSEPRHVATSQGIVRFKIRSKQLTAAFTPLRVALGICGNFPFEIQLRMDGTLHYKHKLFAASSHSIVYLFVVLITSLIFLYLSLGLFCSFIQKPSKSPEQNACDDTWESSLLKAGMVPLIIIYSEFVLLFVCTLYALRYGKDFEFYLNFWNRAVQVMDMDVTYQIRRMVIWENIQMVILVIIIVILSLSRMAPLLDMVCWAISNAFMRFFVLDFYKDGRAALSHKEHQKIYWEKVHNKPEPRPKSPEVFNPTATTIVANSLALFFIIWARISTRQFRLQFLFFCQVLRNSSYIWNERYRHYTIRGKADRDDQTKRRIDKASLIQDHLIIVQLFKLTESNFCVFLQVYYFFQVIKAIVVLYGFGLVAEVGGSTSCSEYWRILRHRSTKCYDIHKGHAHWDNDTHIVAFEDPTAYTNKNKLGDAVFILVLLEENFRSLFKITHIAAAAYEEAMRGWQILRRNSFMRARRSSERNFVHSLIISFARNNPMHISASEYFVLNKNLLVVTLISVLIYFTTLLQFKPGVINELPNCGDGEFDIYDDQGYDEDEEYSEL